MTARATTTSQDLVPKNLPQGSRQKIVAQMQAADLPVSSESVGGGAVAAPGLPAAASPVAAGPAAPVSRTDLASFDVFQNREPTSGFQATPQRQVLFETIRQSDNLVMQAIAERMAGYKEG